MPRRPAIGSVRPVPSDGVTYLITTAAPDQAGQMPTAFEAAEVVRIYAELDGDFKACGEEGSHP